MLGRQIEASGGSRGLRCLWPSSWRTSPIGWRRERWARAPTRPREVGGESSHAATCPFGSVRADSAHGRRTDGRQLRLYKRVSPWPDGTVLILFRQIPGPNIAEYERWQGKPLPLATTTLYFCRKPGPCLCAKRFRGASSLTFNTPLISGIVYPQGLARSIARTLQ